MYAVVSTGGKQIKVAEGDRVRVERIDAPVGELVELEDVCLVATEDSLIADRKSLEGAKVICEVVDQGRAEKIRIFKKRRRKNYKRTKGHRQLFTEIKVREIKLND